MGMNFASEGERDSLQRNDFRAFVFAIPHAHRFDFSVRVVSFRFFFALRLLKKTLKNEQDDDCDYEGTDNSNEARTKMMMMSK